MALKRDTATLNLHTEAASVSKLRMMLDSHSMIDAATSVLQISDSLAITADPTPICPSFGQPNWAPFCFLNGNSLFTAFDAFQLFVQNSVVSLHDLVASFGVEHAYGPSIVLFTVLIRTMLLPVTYLQLASGQKTLQLAPKLEEIKQKVSDKNLQMELTNILYQQSNVNPLAGCFPALLQTPVFFALYRSFNNLGATKELDESFLWIPSLQGPVYGSRTTDWLLKDWENLTPHLGWHDTIAFLSIPIMLVIVQSASLKILSPPPKDEATARSQQILKYLPLFLGYAALNTPASIGVYWIINNILSILSTLSVKQYFKYNPFPLPDINIEELMGVQFSKEVDPIWGYRSREEMVEEARLNVVPIRPVSYIPDDFE